MRFGRWLPLPLALAEAPAGPALFQVRVAEGLLLFPRGKSAMVAYGGGEDAGAALRAAVAGEEGARLAGLGPLLCRFGEAPPGGAEAALLVLRRRFADQFGAPPEAGAAPGAGKEA